MHLRWFQRRWKKINSIRPINQKVIVFGFRIDSFGYHMQTICTYSFAILKFYS